MFKSKYGDIIKIPDKAISFFDNKKEITTIIKKDYAKNYLKRLLQYPDNFFNGMAYVKSRDKDKPKYYIHRITISLFNLENKLLNERCNDFIIPIQKFKLLVGEKFFEKADIVLLKVYITFDKETKKGFVITFKIYLER